MTQQTLPGASSVLTWGIVSLIGTILCCGPLGMLFSIITLVKAGSASTIYNRNPEQYTDYSSVKTGKILAYIGLAIGAIYLLLIILYFGAIAAFIIAGGNTEGL